ncbi:MAG: cytochrome c3 family protein [Vicinamibacterales bacterium]
MHRFVSHAIVVFACALFVGVATPRLFAEAQQAPGTVVLKGAPMGGVKFDHKKHAAAAGDKCETCHHASKPEKPLASAQQACQDCHTKTATAPMKTATRGAFHDATAKKGTCIDCHAQANAKTPGSAPSKCNDCHNKANGN